MSRLLFILCFLHVAFARNIKSLLYSYLNLLILYQKLAFFLGDRVDTLSVKNYKSSIKNYINKIFLKFKKSIKYQS